MPSKDEGRNVLRRLSDEEVRAAADVLAAPETRPDTPEMMLWSAPRAASSEAEAELFEWFDEVIAEAVRMRDKLGPVAGQSMIDHLEEGKLRAQTVLAARPVLSGEAIQVALTARNHFVLAHGPNLAECAARDPERYRRWWRDFYAMERAFAAPRPAVGEATALARQARALCYLIEELPASEPQTRCSIAASDLLRAITHPLHRATEPEADVDVLEELKDIAHRPSYGIDPRDSFDEAIGRVNRLIARLEAKP